LGQQWHSDHPSSLHVETVRKTFTPHGTLTLTRKTKTKTQTAIPLKTDEWKGKKVVIVSVPGAFTVNVASVDIQLG
jgi:peroxiredoxin